MDKYIKEKETFINFLEGKSYEYGWGEAIEIAAEYYVAYLDHKIENNKLYEENKKLYEENIQLKETISNNLIYEYIKNIDYFNS